MSQNPSRTKEKMSFYCMRQKAGRKQESKKFVSTPDDVYGFEYKLKNARSARRQNAEKISKRTRSKSGSSQTS